MKYKPFCATEILFCTKNQLFDDMLSTKNKRIFFVISHGSVHRHGLQRLLQDLGAQNELTIFYSSCNNPTPQDIEEAVSFLGDVVPDVVVALGGGSVIDLAKGVLSNFPDGKTEFFTVPTTFGTGSEITEWATVWDKANSQKLSLDELFLKPTKAYIVSEFAKTIPAALLLTTTLDALSHAMEAFWSVFSNPLVRQLSLSATRLIAENLPLALEDAGNFCARERLCEASVLSALSFSQTRTTACHAISYPLTLEFDIPHGLAVAMTLESVAQANSAIVGEISELVAVFLPFGGFARWLEGITSKTELKLSTYGVTAADLPKLAAMVFTNNRMNNNPKILTEKEVLEILFKIL